MPPLQGLNDFTRVIWSANAGQWKDIFTAVSKAWQQYEMSRRYSITTVKSEDLARFLNQTSESNEDSVLLGAVNDKGMYANNVGPVNFNDNVSWRVMTGFNLRGKKLDDESIGKILGYPDCCVKFFVEQWTNAGNIDYTWPAWNNMSTNGAGHYVAQCNIFLRYLGIRPIFHLPCAFDCWETQKLGTENVYKFREMFPSEADYLREILSWPLYWSSVNGVAEIRFPLGKIIARSDYYAYKVEIKVPGSRYPLEGESGIVWPYTEKGKLLKDNKEVMPLLKKSEKEVNGFKTFESQLSAHVWLSSELSRYIKAGKFIDLGAGNGDLIRHLEKVYPEMKGWGVDLNFFSEKNPPIFKTNIVNFDLYEVDRWDIALIAEQRFFDTYLDEQAALEHIATFADAVFVYNYTTRKCKWQSFKSNQESE